MNECVATSKSGRYQGVIAFSPRLFSPDALLTDAPLLSCIIRLPPFEVLKRDLSMRDQVVVRYYEPPRCPKVAATRRRWRA